MFVKEILISIFIVTVPNLVVTQFNFSDKLIYFVLGLTVGVDLGWWGYYFLSDSKTRRIKAEAERVTSEAERVKAEAERTVAETARLTEENAEKQRQWKRECQERLAAETDAVKAAEEEKKKKVQFFMKGFEICAGGKSMVSKNESDKRKYCVKCAREKAEAVALKLHEFKLWWYCPSCGKNGID